MRKTLTPMQAEVMLIAMNVRNHMEDFHVKHLTDAQMKELNPLIRNAIYEMLQLLAEMNAGNLKAQRAVEFIWSSIPQCWESPRLKKEIKRWLAES